MVYVVERYIPGYEPLRRSYRFGRAHSGSDPSRVRYLGSTIVFSDKACLSQFQGASAAIVADANCRAGLPFDRSSPPSPLSPPKENADEHLARCIAQSRT
jgi:hypothetical protein